MCSVTCATLTSYALLSKSQNLSHSPFFNVIELGSNPLMPLSGSVPITCHGASYTYITFLRVHRYVTDAISNSDSDSENVRLQLSDDRILCLGLCAIAEYGLFFEVEAPTAVFQQEGRDS